MKCVGLKQYTMIHIREMLSPLDYEVLVDQFVKLVIVIVTRCVTRVGVLYIQNDMNLYQFLYSTRKV